MRRRTVLTALVGGSVALPGCLGQGPATGPSTSTSTAATTRTGTPTRSEADVYRPPCPDRPDPVTASNVARFAVEFERAYFVREVLRKRERVIEVDPGSVPDDEVQVSRADGGYLVRFPVVDASYQYRSDGGERVYYDAPTFHLHYLISKSRIFRARTENDTTVDPREDGERVRCPPN